MNILESNKDAEINDDSKKILILSCGTGGGHNTAAKAIQEELLARGIKTDFREYLEIINPKLKDRVNNLYIKSTNRNGKVFKRVYRLGVIYEKTKLKSPVYFLNSLNKKKIYTYIKENQYSFIITTHLFAAQALTAIKKEHDIHFLQVATDYVSIPFWEETNPDYFVIPSKELEANFIEKGMKKQKLLPLGIPVRKQFREEYQMEEIKKQLQLNSDKKYILILNGSMGFGNVKEIVKKLLENTKDYIFIISCGNNHELFDFLNNKYKNNNRIIALPYTNELGKYIASCEVILSKPGGLTTTEIATMRKPLIHIMPIPGCENNNVDFFSERKMSIKCENIEQVVSNTKELIENEALQNEIIENQKRYISGDSCEKIADIVIKELNRGNTQWKKQFIKENIEEEIQNENEDIIHMYEPLELKLDKKYQYINEGKVFSFFSNFIYYGVAFPVLTILNKIIYDLKIEGKENIKNIKTGAISVSNHVLILDCTMVGLALGLKKVYFTTREGSFKIPIIRRLIKLLRAIPIPTNINNKVYFVKQLDNALKKGKIIHFYPEKALWPYYEEIRNFKTGAFNFAVKNNVPVIPILITFREPKGIRKIFKKKKDVTVKILKPIIYKENEHESKKDSINKLKDKVHNEMEKYV